jgi:5-methyltetrahydrofolate--homocysteine methyltransferase
VSPQFVDALSRGVLLADGAMATELQRMGLALDGCAALWNVDAPDRVLNVHRAYVDAGATVLLTNTFLGGRFALERHGAAHRVRELSAAGVKLARTALGNRAGTVLGNIGPFGGKLGEVSADAVSRAFREHADALLDAGCDGLALETHTCLEELNLAMRAAQASGAKVVIASLAFNGVGGVLRTPSGATPEQAGPYLRDGGADVVGLNCGADLDVAAMSKVLGILGRACSLPLYAKPNAGTPELENGRIVYRRGAESMARDLHLLIEAGARIVGGCCGTTPEHIRAFRKTLVNC